MTTQQNPNETAGAGGATFEPFIDRNEVARRTQMRPRTIEQWMRRGMLPYYRVGRSIRFKWSEVESHLKATCRVCMGVVEGHELMVDGGNRARKKVLAKAVSMNSREVGL